MHNALQRERGMATVWKEMKARENRRVWTPSDDMQSLSSDDDEEALFSDDRSDSSSDSSSDSGDDAERGYSVHFNLEQIRQRS